MKKLFILIFVLFFTFLCKAQQNGKDTIFVAQWNVENLFDAVDDPEKDDKEFLPESEKFWTDGKIEVKLNNLAKVINYLNNGKGPDVFTIEEVENFSMMKRLAYKLKDREYIPAHRESPDERGIDVGLFYDRNIFEIEKVIPIRVDLPSKYPTRDILHVELTHKKTGELFDFFVNHWPSRRGGKEKSEINRIAAAKILRSYLDSLFTNNPKANVVILGDFNDEPEDYSLTKYLSAKDFDCTSKEQTNSLLNLAYKKSENDEGSYLFSGQWDMIDQIIISSALNDGAKFDYICGSFDVVKPVFMTIENGSRKGGGLPTYIGNKYVGGFSDHFPVVAKFCFIK